MQTIPERDGWHFKTHGRAFKCAIYTLESRLVSRFIILNSPEQEIKINDVSRFIN